MSTILWLIACVVCLVVGFGAGFLVFRNNQELATDLEGMGRDAVDRVKRG